MKVSIEDVRRQYAELSDSGLLEIDREDLVDQARHCYDEELVRRQLTGRQTAAPASRRPEDPTRETEDLVEAAAQVPDEDPAGEALADLSYIRNGVGAVRPYIYGKLDLLAFVQQVFGSVELERHEFSPTACHVEAMIGDSVVVMEVSDPPHNTAAPASIYVYVPDVDAVYARALEAGGVSVAVPTDKPYDERSAGVKDSFGNTWWISTYQGT